jgi:hypothetical protein
MVEGYCVKCKKKVEIQDGVLGLTVKKVKILKGRCPTCGITVCRIGSVL